MYIPLKDECLRRHWLRLLSLSVSFLCKSQTSSCTLGRLFQLAAPCNGPEQPFREKFFVTLAYHPQKFAIKTDYFHFSSILIGPINKIAVIVSTVEPL